MTPPTQDIELVALIRPGSALARSWKLAKPTYGIYEYAKAFDRHQLRFGDGSWQDLEPEHIPDLVLLDTYSTALVERLFGD